MAQYQVIENSGSRITVFWQNGHYPVELRMIVKSDWSPVAPSDIMVGDILSQTSDGRSMLMPPTFPDVIKLQESVYRQFSPNWVATIFPYIRPLHPGERNISIALGLQIVEKACLYKDSSIFIKLKSYLPQEYYPLIDWLIGKMNQGTFKEIIESFKQITSTTIEIIGRDVYKRFNSNFQTLAEGLNLSIKFLDLPNLTLRGINPNGATEMNFLSMNGCLSILYDKKESFLMENDKELIKFDKNFKTYRRDAIDPLKNEYFNLDKKNAETLEMIYKSVDLLINSFRVDDYLYRAIGYLQHYNYNTSSLMEKIKNIICCDCRQCKQLIIIDCNHKYCIDCFTKLIASATLNKFVLNSIERANTRDIKCTFPECKGVISNKTIEKNLPNYEYYKNKAEERINLKCTKCSYSSKIIEDFIMNCRHLCNYCLFDCLRDKKHECPACDDKMQKKDLKIYKEKYVKCDGCCKLHNGYKYFTNKMCNDHLCLECLKLCSSNNTCLVCEKKLLNGNLDLSNIDVAICIKCNQRILKKDYFYTSKDCECSLCDDCQLPLKEKCAVCNIEFSNTTIVILAEKEKKIEIQRSGRRKICIIDTNEHDIDDIINMAGCDHNICKECFKNNVDYLAEENNVDNIKRCPGCLVEIPDWQLEHLVSNDVWDKISWVEIQKTHKIINCPKCKFPFIPGIQRKVMCLNPTCKYLFCKECQEQYHDVGNCQDKFIEERIKDLEALNDDNGIAQCPRCRLPYIKDPKCDHVKCLENSCRIEFCFNGACLRSPTMAHGNHYHRPECKFYDYYHGKDDRYLPDKCEMCKKLGELCKPPKALKAKARVSPDEAVL
jgi:hypothetical protein